MSGAQQETVQPQARKHWLERKLPVLSWLSSYQKSSLRPDLLAGATVWAVVIPEAIAYAQLAGVPAQMGLFAAPFLMLGYVLFGTSRQLMVGATSASAIMLATTAGNVVQGSSANYPAVVTGITLLVGLLLLLLGLAHLGFVKNFLAEPILTGFIFGLALVIGVGQVPKILGLPRVEGDFFAKVWQVISHLGDTNGWTLLLGALSLALLFLLDHFWPRIPASLVVVVGGILAVSLFHLEQVGVAIVGAIPAGLPLPTFPMLPLQTWLTALPDSFGIALVIYAEHISAAQQFATRYHY
ncbi:MAG: SulP family inorganic anion transporter, partial [Ktedonobacteraceae bacterium]|nr:SulP family inorganic anion transporter [Ktedonobacteraceae bacterium]